MSYTTHVLKNGLRLITVPRRDTPSVTVMVLVEAGSKYERAGENGISHFLEHMCFKGTVKRPKPMQISAELDALGAQYNAFTSYEFTGYYAKVASTNVRKAIEIVSDLYLNPTFNPKEIEREKGVIIEEMNMYEDLPNRKVQDDATALLYGDQPAGRSVLGTKEIIRGVNRKDFLAYRSEHYLPQSTIVVVSGSFREKDIVREVERHFNTLTHAVKRKKEPVRDTQHAPRVFVRSKKSDQSHVVIAFRGYPVTSAKSYAAMLLASILGGTMSSRLWQVVREKLGAAYYVRAGHEALTDHGVFEISAGLDTSRITEVLRAITGEISKLKRSPVSKEELSRSKDSIIGRFLLSLERSDDLAEYYGLQEVIKGSILTPEQYNRAIRRVSADELRAVAREIFVTAHMNLAVIGPHESDAPFVPLMKV